MFTSNDIARIGPTGQVARADGIGAPDRQGSIVVDHVGRKTGGGATGIAHNVGSV